MTAMEHVTSADGTRIALQRTGTGSPVVLVGGAFSTAAAGTALAEALAERGHEGVSYDRRARGASGDTRPYAPEREAEDLAAVIAAVGGDAAVFGHSSGAVLALTAAAGGVRVTHLFLSEPPFRFRDVSAVDDLPERLQALVDADRPDEAVVLFQREAVGLPDAVIAQIRQSPMFPALVAVAQSVVYDATLTRAVATPTAAMRSVSVPTTILRGSRIMPFLEQAVDQLAAAMPSAELVVVPESVDHAVDPAGTARVVAERLA